MHRRFSSLVKGGASSSSSSFVEKGGNDDAASTSTVVREEVLTPPSLKVKRVDYYYSRWTKSWKYRNTSSKVQVESAPMQSGSNDIWKDFTFVIVRTLRENRDPEFKLVVKSEYILKACKDVIKTWPGVSWNNDPLELDPEIFITFHPSFLEYASNLASQKTLSQYDSHVLNSVNLLTRTIASDYSVTLATIQRLTSHGEITFPLMHAILVPGEIMLAKCSVTGGPRLFELQSWVRVCIDGKPMYQLTLQSIDLVDRQIGNQHANTANGKPHSAVVVGRIQTIVYIKPVRGTVSIESLDVYPLKYHSDVEGLTKRIQNRGKAWTSLIGVHHMQYDGIAALKMDERVVRHNVRSRIMIDRATFRRLNSNYSLPTPVPPKPEDSAGLTDGDSRFNNTNVANPLAQLMYDNYGNPINQPVLAVDDNLVQTQSSDDTPEVELTLDELLLTPTVVFGFSLSDKVWLEFDVEKIRPVEWNHAAFANLVLPSSRKELLQSLVEAHHKELGFDDFIKGKGHGLVVNLFGPPGVGKTFSAEATSEHVKRPLYVVGGGDLGTTANVVDQNLERIFDIAESWKAIVLIDEADVFLERRGVGDLERNAMVAVFLRHVEYYRGILFLTTNRVKAFDEAFLSRIHVALHFKSLDQQSKARVWRAFIGKLGALATSDGTPTGETGMAGVYEGITDAEIWDLATRDINGRQIKNAARTAHSLSISKGEKKVKFEHLRDTLDAMEEFTREFEKGSSGVEF